MIEQCLSAALVLAGSVVLSHAPPSPAVLSGFYARLTNAIGPAAEPVVIGIRVNGVLRGERVSIPVYGSPLNQYTRQNGLAFPPLDVGQEYCAALDAPLALNPGDSVAVEVVSSGPMTSGITAGLRFQGRAALTDLREPFRPTKAAGPVSRIAWSQREVICTGNQVKYDPYCAPQNNSGVVADPDNTLYQFTSFYSVDEQYGGGRGGSIARIFGFRKNPGSGAWDSIGLIADPVPDTMAYAGDPFAFRDMDNTPCLVYTGANGTNGFSDWTLIDARLLRSTTKSFAGPWGKPHRLIASLSRSVIDRVIGIRIYPRPATGDYVMLWQRGTADITVQGVVISSLEATLTQEQVMAAPVLVRNQEEGGGGFIRGDKGYLSTWQIPNINDPSSVERLYEFDLADALNPEKWSVVPGSWGWNDGTNAVEDGGETADSWSLSMVGDTLWATTVVWSVTSQRNSILACHVPWNDRFGQVFTHGVPRVSGYQETAPVVEYAVGRQCAIECEWTGFGSLSYLFLLLAPSNRPFYYGGFALEVSDKGARLNAYSDAGAVTPLTAYSGPVFTPGQAYPVKLQRDGNRLTGWVDGLQVGPVEITDAGSLALLSEPQRFKFYGWQGGLYKIQDAWITDGPESATPSESQSVAEHSCKLQVINNPFNPACEISVELATTSRAMLEVFSPSGQRVKVLCNRILSRGSHKFQWDASADGKAVASGTYILRLSTEDGVIQKRVVLLK